MLIWICNLTKNADPGKYKYSGYGIGFDSCSEFSFTDGSMWKNVIIFGADMSSSVHVDNKNKYILIFGEERTQGLDDTTLTAEVIYSINSTQRNKRFVLGLDHNRSNSILFVNANHTKCLSLSNQICMTRPTLINLHPNE